MERIGGFIFGSLCPYGICLAALYFPALFALKDWLGGFRPIWLFALVCVVMGVIPTAVIMLFVGGSLRSLYSSDALFLYAGWAALGLVLGIGFPCIYRETRSNNDS